MLRIGFINVRRKTYNVPIGGWAKEQRLRVIGRLMKEVCNDLCVAMSARPFIEYGMEEREREELRDSVKAALNDRTAHAQMTIHVIIGQKPPLSANPSTTSFGGGQQQQQ